MKTLATAFFFFVSLSAFSQHPSFRDSTAMTKTISSQYFEAYMAMKFDEMAKLMDSNISFDDPTSRYAVGWDKVEGKENVLNFFKTNYSSILEFKPVIQRSYFSSNDAVFQMDLTFKFTMEGKKNPLTITMPLTTVVTVKGNRVVAHRDLGDYIVYMQQLREQLK
jgi:limonene-1,2-epoxide hydrolase